MTEASGSRAVRAKARVTPRGLQLAPGIEFDAWTAIGRRVAIIANASAWCLGDWLVYGERAFPARYKTALAATSLDYQTLRNYAWVARRFEVSRRRDNLSLQHHAEVAALPEPEQDLWLHRAERSHWSRNELRRRVGAARRASRRGIPDSAVRVSVEVTRTREQRWREAADAAHQTLPEWIATAVDAAADATLIGPPHAPVELTQRT
ncbi:MAG TPA: LmbU family transcriptional regulator [Solirubrobacteraceae bacterium]|nr:LmbU family transcriptional regulator [Solirubrobacteraceae bacterium]